MKKQRINWSKDLQTLVFMIMFEELGPKHMETAWAQSDKAPQGLAFREVVEHLAAFRNAQIEAEVPDAQRRRKFTWHEATVVVPGLYETWREAGSYLHSLPAPTPVQAAVKVVTEPEPAQAAPTAALFIELQNEVKFLREMVMELIDKVDRLENAEKPAATEAPVPAKTPYSITATVVNPQAKSQWPGPTAAPAPAPTPEKVKKPVVAVIGMYDNSNVEVLRQNLERVNRVTFKNAFDIKLLYGDEKDFGVVDCAFFMTKSTNHKNYIRAKQMVGKADKVHVKGSQTDLIRSMSAKLREKYPEVFAKGAA